LPNEFREVVVPLSIGVAGTVIVWKKREAIGDWAADAITEASSAIKGLWEHIRDGLEGGPDHYGNNPRDSNRWSETNGRLKLTRTFLPGNYDPCLTTSQRDK
jgi:hypothetical protein